MVLLDTVTRIYAFLPKNSNTFSSEVTGIKKKNSARESAHLKMGECLLVHLISYLIGVLQYIEFYPPKSPQFWIYP